MKVIKYSELYPLYIEIPEVETKRDLKNIKSFLFDLWVNTEPQSAQEQIQKNIIWITRENLKIKKTNPTSD